MKDIFNFEFDNGIKLKNRFVVAPMTTYSGNKDLTLSDEEEKYYAKRGQSFGMVITAATAISKHAQAFTNQISIQDESYLPSMKRLASTIKQGGAKAILQIHHGGRMNATDLYEDQDIVSASAIKAERKNAPTPRALKTEEVYDVIDDFAHATKLAIEAGFDGIELHGANTYLIQQFFSPHSNRREDEFGGSLEKRTKFSMLLINQALDMRTKYANKEFIIGYRLSPEEYEDPGITIEDTLYLIDKIIKKDIDYIHLSLGKYNQSSIRNSEDEEPIISKIKSVVKGKTPIIGVGQIDGLSQAKDALKLGFDLLAVGMGSLADPHYPKHLKNGQAPKKEINEESLLPKPLFERLHKWRGLEDRGYQIKNPK
ncbi:MAG: NADH-dependent flavin oxidoreductase [Tenericutes bacterium]|jgi:2,4-dienoyl-CoA reductase-like NADH-dependent reductase (Old Yellow Enzyme family)|nr:NADH-dependent flavin oxidoreductase [Mycoplasmatota bacterium]